MGATMKVTFAFLALASHMVSTELTNAQSYPTRPIRLIVPSAAGSSPDISARNLAPELTKQMGQSVVVDNRPGASNIIGFELIARAAPDGYTLGYISNTLAANPSLFSALPYDTNRDFAPIILFGSSPNLLAVTPALPVRSLKELIDYARAKPGALSFGNNGIGASGHFAMELLKASTSTNMVHVAYKGNQQAITDVISGQIHLVCEPMSSVLPHVKGGRVRGLGVTSLKRAQAIPELPTFDESGIPGYEVINLGGYSFPANVPRNMVIQLNSEMNKALLTPSVSKSIETRGSTAIGGTPEHFADFIRRELEKWGKVAKAAGIKPQ